MANKTRQQLNDEIEVFCDQARCREKTRTIHRAQYVDRNWNPHPPQKFVNWWGATGIEASEKKTGQAWTDIDAIRAFNCEHVREIYSESRQYGIT